MHNTEDLVRAFFLGVLVTLGIIGGLISITGDTYKHGQIDAINGKVKYHLVKQEDNSMTWEYISNE